MLLLRLRGDYGPGQDGSRRHGVRKREPHLRLRLLLLCRSRRAWNEGFEGGGAQSDAGRILGGYLGAQAVRSGTRQLFNSAGSVEQERKLLQAQSGLTPDDLTEIEKRAEDISSRYKQITKAAAMRAISELRMALTDIQGAEHSMEFMETAAKAHTVLTNMTHVGKLAGVNADEAVFDLAKAMELRGITTKEGMEHGVDMMIKGIIASGGKIDARDWHMVSKALRSSLNQMSDEFLYKFMPTFMQEMKAGGGTGVQAGTAGLSLYRTIVGGRMTPRAAAQFDDLGLLNEDRVERKKNGDIKWLNPDAVVGNDIAQKDMFKWVNEVLKPALERKGITDIAEQARYFSTLFSNQVSEHMANMLLTQSNRLQRDAEMISMTC